MSVKRESSLRLGDVIESRFKLVDIIGEGGMGTVYLVRDLKLEKFWALKEVQVTNTPKGKAKYESIITETNILKSLDYPNIPTIVDIFQTKYAILIIMEYVDGKSMREFVTSPDSVSNKRLVKWAIELCNILGYLHNRKIPIIYRDLKPQNIMVTNSKDLKLLDFGISVEMKEGLDITKLPRVGTKGYAPPEQMAKPPYFDNRSDIYALGRTLYYLATGTVPRGDDLKPIRSWNPNRTPAMEKIIFKAMAENIEERYQSVEQMIYDLQNIDKLSSEYMKSVSKKLAILGSLSFLSVGLMLGGVSTYLGEQKKLENNFQQLVTNAKVTNDYNLLVQALVSKPLEFETYKELFDLIKSDNTISKEEEESLLYLWSTNKPLIEDKKEFGNVSYNLGRLFWYYADGGKVKSVSFFEDAIKKGTSFGDIARVYLEMGTFNKNILSAITDLSDAGMYSKYWKSLKEVLTLEVENDLVTLTLSQSVLDLLDVYTGSLKSDGVSRGDVEAVLSDINNSITNLSPSTPKMQEQKEELLSRFKQIREKVERVYSKGGE